jgi:hypothetical protein
VGVHSLVGGKWRGGRGHAAHCLFLEGKLRLYLLAKSCSFPCRTA